MLISLGAMGAATALVLAATSHTTGNFICIGCKYEGAATTVTATDTAGNTYTGLTQRNHSNGDIHVRLLYAFNITGGAANVITVTLAASRPFRRAFALQYSGILTTDPIDDQDTGQANSGTAMSTTDLTVSTSEAVIVAMAGEYAALTYTAGTNFTERVDFNVDTAGVIGGTGAEDRIVSSAANYAVPFTQSVSAEWLMASAAP